MRLYYRNDQDWVLKMQPLAIRFYYRKIWPECEIKCLDDELDNNLKKILDISGADKLLRWPNGTVSFLAQRFRRHDERNYDDFTLRYDRPSGYKAEMFKARDALKKHKLIPAYYAYGHVNENEDGFKRFRVIDFIVFLDYLERGQLPEPEFKENRDKSSTFMAWNFNIIPKECILNEFLEDLENKFNGQTSLSSFMK